MYYQLISSTVMLSIRSQICIANNPKNIQQIGISYTRSEWLRILIFTISGASFLVSTKITRYLHSLHLFKRLVFHTLSNTHNNPKEVKANLLTNRCRFKHCFQNTSALTKLSHSTWLLLLLPIWFAGWENQIFHPLLDGISWFPSLALNKQSLYSSPPFPTAKMQR